MAVLILFYLVLRLFVWSLIFVRLRIIIRLAGYLRWRFRTLTTLSQTVINFILIFIRISWRINFILVIFLEYPTIFIYHHLLSMQEFFSFLKVRCITSYHEPSRPLRNMRKTRINSELATLLFVAHQVHIVVIRGRLLFTHIFDGRSALRIGVWSLALFRGYRVDLLLFFAQFWYLRNEGRFLRWVFDRRACVAAVVGKLASRCNRARTIVLDTTAGAMAVVLPCWFGEFVCARVFL